MREEIGSDKTIIVIWIHARNCETVNKHLGNYANIHKPTYTLIFLVWHGIVMQ